MVRRQNAALFLDPGLGKTSITLSAIKTLKTLGLVRRVLVVAPLRVVYSVWPREVEKWDSFRDLRVSIVHGTPKKRREALQKDADVFLINPENIDWLSKEDFDDFDVLVIDESTKFKSPSSKRFKALRRILGRFARRWILTGTPSPNGFHDLWSQLFIVDQGETLGQRVTHFRNRFFYRGGFNGYEYKLIPGKGDEIEKLISPLVLRFDAEDFLDLPPLIYNDISVELPAKVLAAYAKLKRELATRLNGEVVLTFSAAHAYNLLRQLANGGAYAYEDDGDKSTRRSIHVHKAKLDALSDLRDELHGKPLLVAYQFKHDLERLLERFPKTPYIAGGVAARATTKIVNRWNDGDLPLLFVQPDSVSHGLNMQGAGNDLAWVGLTDNLETYLQTNRRIYRQGVTGDSVRVHRLIAKGTVDELIARRLDKKETSQRSLLNSLRDYTASALST